MYNVVSFQDAPAHLGILYFDEPDGTGHAFGPNSKELEDMIVEMDDVIGYLMYQLHENDVSSVSKLKCQAELF